MAAPVVGAAKCDAFGKMTTLGPRSSPNDAVSIDDVSDTSKLARLLGKLFDAVSTLMARWYPRRIDFEDIPVVAFNPPLQLQHNFNGRVRWWVVDWVSTGSTGPIFTSDPSQKLSTASTLILYPYSTGTVTIRVEEAG